MLPDHLISVGQRDGRTSDIADRDAGAELELTEAEGAGRTDVQHAVGEIEAGRTSPGAREREGARTELGNRGDEVHATREGQRRTVGACAVDPPGLDAAHRKGGGEGDRAGVGLDLDAVVGTARNEG